MNTLHKEIENIKNQLIEKYKPEKIILFGSHAWGEPHRDSDFDFCIIKEGVSGKSRYQRMLEVERLIEYKEASDFFVYTPYEIKKRIWLGDPFIRKIVNEGKVIYDQ